MNITEKFSLHDLVSLLLPSSLVVYCFTSLPCCTRMKFLDTSSDNILTGSLHVFLLIAILLLIGLVLKSIASLIFRGILTGECMRCCAWQQYQKSLVTKSGKEEVEMTASEYNTRYYYARQNAYCEHIEILESHVSFLTTWAVASAISLIPTIVSCCCCCCIVCLLTIGIFVAIVLAFALQHKIFKLVFEDYDYLKSKSDDKQN